MDIETIGILNDRIFWLIIAIVFMFLFRKQIGIQILKTKKIFLNKDGLEAEFNELDELRKNIPQIKDKTPSEKKAKLGFIDLYGLAESSPRLAIVHAWGFIETESIFSLFKTGFFKKEPPDKIVRNTQLLIQALINGAIVDDKLGNYLKHLHITNKIALEHLHIQISQKEAINYLDQAEIIYNYLKEIKQEHGQTTNS